MKNRYELSQYIRFQLEQMSAKNQFHQFEELAFQLARLRVTPKLLPATGPVQAGGDGGRDFETYRSDTTSFGKNRPFAVSSTSEPAFFGCTLERQPFGKIKSDVQSMLRGPALPKSVYYFTARDLPVANRHRLEAECEEKHGIRLVIFDGQAVADMLADPDTFWIAEQFLSVPNEFFPPIEANEGYKDLRRRWLASERSVINHADFGEVKRGLRWSTLDEELAPDVSQWLALIERLAATPNSLFQLKATYEAAFGRLAAERSLRGLEPLLLHYFSEPPGDGSAHVEDAVRLVGLVGQGVDDGDLDLLGETVVEWRRNVRLVTNCLLGSEGSPSLQFRLLLTRSILDLDALGHDDQSEFAGLLFRDWDRATDIAGRTKFADVSMLAALVESAVPLFGTYDQFAPLARRVDAIVAERAGRDAAALNCYKRSKKFAQSNNLIAAVREMHRALEGWLNEKTMSQTIDALTTLCAHYEELGLPLAARYCSAVALVFSQLSYDEGLRAATGASAMMFADSYLQNGEAINFLAAAGGAISLHVAFARDPLDMDRHKAFAILLARASDIRAIIASLDARLLEAADDALSKWKTADWWGIIEDSRRSRFFQSPPANIIATLQDDLGGSLFNDIGETLQFRWKLFGATWTIEAQSHDRTHAERLAAGLQIMQVDAANTDLMLLPQNLKIILSVEDKPDLKLEPTFDPVSEVFHLTLPATLNRGEENFSKVMFFSFLSLLTSLSVLPEKRLQETLREMENVALSFGSRSGFSFLRQARGGLLEEEPRLSHLSRPAGMEALEPCSAHALSWHAEPAPGFSPARAQEVAADTYERAHKATATLLPRLRDEPATRAVLQRLRDEGWLDWHILDALAYTAIELLVDENSSGTHSASRKRRKAWRSAARRLTGGEILDLDLSRFSYDALKGGLLSHMRFILDDWGMQLRHPAPDLGPLRQLLSDRFGYMTDVPRSDMLVA